MSDEGFLQAQDVWFAYNESRPALQGITVTVQPGEFVALIGQNGSGKTTLAKHFNGLLRPTRGQILIEGNDIRGDPIGKLAKTVGYVFQNPDHQIFSASVYDEVQFGPRNLGFDVPQLQSAVREALALFGLVSVANQSPATLSFGLRRKVTLAAVYAMQTPILILDEPTAGLDWKGTVELMSILVDLHRQGRTILIITHDMRLVADYMPRSIVLNEGKVAAYDATRNLFQHPEQLAATKLEPPQVTALAQRLAPHGMPRDIITVDEFCNAYEDLLVRENKSTGSLP